MSDARPAGYGRQKLAMLRTRWNGPAGEAVRRYGPTIFPGMPPTALMGLTASSMGPTERIGNLETAGSAVGLFGLEGPNVRALAGSREVRELLGRAVSPELIPAGYLGDIPGQVVTGLLGYRGHGSEVARRVPEVFVGDRLGSSSFALRVTAAAYSAGDGIVSAALDRWHTRLQGVGIADRWRELARAIDGTAAGALVGRYRVDGRYGIAHFCMRAEGRLEAGRQLEFAVNGNARADWFDAWVGGEVELVDRVVLRGFGSFDTGHDGAPTSPASGGDGLGLLELLGLAAAAVRWLW